jgi:thiamine-monophosphate kinase
VPSESHLLAHIYRRSHGMSVAHPVVIVGPGDDCAVVRVDDVAHSLVPRASGGSHLMITVDQLVEGRHFTRGTAVERIARKAVARSVSDIAAMGGSPVWSLATGTLSPRFEHADALFDAMHRWAAHWGCPLIGGDIAVHAPLVSKYTLQTPDGGRADVAPPPPMVLTVTVAGVPHPSRGPVLRSTARAGDIVYVTGRLGGSFGSGRHLTFDPRVREGLWLAETLRDDLHAMIDISDGLGRDAGRVAAASGVQVRIEVTAIPCHHGSSIDDAIGDGEDHELLFAADPRASVPNVCGITGTSITRIGTVVDGTGCVAIDAQGIERDISEQGWDHTGDQP